VIVSTYIAVMSDTESLAKTSLSHRPTELKPIMTGPDIAPPDAPKACQARKNPPSYEVGYGRPPKSTQWQKGQCGNPKRIRNKNPKPVVDMIDEFFAGEIDIKENGISRRVNNLEAILLQLWIKVMDGKKRAMNVLLQYQAFASRRSGGMGGVIHRVEELGEDVSGEEPRGNA